jgi:hypothetical protein
MNEALGERVHREFCWFALVLVALLVACATDRLVPGTLPSSTAAGDNASAGAAQPDKRP